MAMLGNIDALYSLEIRSFYTRFEGLVLSCPLDRMLFNKAFVTCAHYFIYWELGLWRYHELEKLVIVELHFDMTSLEVGELVNLL